MAGVHQLGWKAIPAVRSGYGADTLPDRYRSDEDLNFHCFLTEQALQLFYLFVVVNKNCKRQRSTVLTLIYW